MESYYDIGTSDLKDIWDSDLDPVRYPSFHLSSEAMPNEPCAESLNLTSPVFRIIHASPFLSDTLKLSADTDMQDWFLERDVKMPQVILHDKLISDALLGTLPIKTEHSYSLNSDGDSMPDSPRSLQTKMDDMDDDCYPAISMSTASSNIRRLMDTTPISSHITNSSSSGTTSSHSNSNAITVSLRNSKQQQQQQHTAEKHSIQQNSLRSAAQIETSEIEIEECHIKDEPMSPSSSCPPSPNSSNYGLSLNMANMAALTNTNLVFEHKNGSLQLSPTSQSLLKNQQIIFSGTAQNSQRIVIPKLNIKMESQSSHLFGLPPTPPSSLPSDESEGNQSPEHHLTSPMSPQSMQNTTISSTITTTATRRNTSSSSSTSTSPASHISSTGRGYSGSSSRQPIHTPLISSQPKGSTGTLILTEEEKRTLLAEGYPIPTRLPLTKAEEKSLKKIRRKIKNKISAQESRRKKKEYMDQLERRVEILVTENSDYKKRVESLEDSNANLLNQLAKLQALLNRQNTKKI